jgi:HME family heavy-metal exporter
VPLLIDAATPGKEILHPVAVTIVGGLLSATVLDTLLTPVLFLRYGKRSLERLQDAEGRAEVTRENSTAEAF